MARKFGVSRSTIHYWAYPERRRRLQGKELAEHRKKHREYERAKRAKRTDEEQAEHRKKHREYQRAYRAAARQSGG